MLDFILVRESPESYIQQIRKVPEALEPHIQLGAQKAALQRRMKKEYGVDFKELKQLSSIYIVSVSGKKLVSKLSEEHKKLLERLELKRETALVKCKLCLILKRMCGMIESVDNWKRIGNKMELDNNAHSVFLLYYHLILVVKYRRAVFDEVLSNRAKEIFMYISPNYHITLQEWNYDKDHVHILFKAHPKSEISKFINAYKSASSRLLKKEFPFLRETLWKEYFWSQSFCLLTTGEAPAEVIRQYIESQGKKPRGRKRGKQSVQIQDVSN